MILRHSVIAAALALSAAGQTACAEEADYGLIELTGLSRDGSWPYNPPGPATAMVCNVNGPDGFLSIRSEPDEGSSVARRLNRLAEVEIDTRERRGSWVRVLGAHRTFTAEGERTAPKELPVTGWAHDGYLCDFIDYPAPGELESAGTDAAAPAEARIARCDWDNGAGAGAEGYDCEVIPFDGRGSFSVVRADGYELMLEIEGADTATLTEFLAGRQGVRFGSVRRDAADPDCWDGQEGTERLCVR